MLHVDWAVVKVKVIREIKCNKVTLWQVETEKVHGFLM